MVYSVKKAPVHRSAARTKSYSRPGDKPGIGRGSTAGFVPPSLDRPYMKMVYRDKNVSVY